MSFSYIRYIITKHLSRNLRPLAFVAVGSSALDVFSRSIKLCCTFLRLDWVATPATKLNACGLLGPRSHVGLRGPAVSKRKMHTNATKRRKPPPPLPDFSSLFPSDHAPPPEIPPLPGPLFIQLSQLLRLTYALTETMGVRRMQPSRYPH